MCVRVFVIVGSPIEKNCIELTYELVCGRNGVYNCRLTDYRKSVLTYEIIHFALTYICGLHQLVFVRLMIILLTSTVQVCKRAPKIAVSVENHFVHAQLLI